MKLSLLLGIQAVARTENWLLTLLNSLTSGIITELAKYKGADVTKLVISWIKRSTLAQGGGSPNSHRNLVQVMLQHISDIRVELGSQERAREHIVVAMVTELGKQVLVLERSSGGREASLYTHGLMVCLKDMEHSSTDSLVLMAEREVNTTMMVMYWTIQRGPQFSLIIQGGGSQSSHCSVTMSNLAWLVIISTLEKV